MATGGVERRLSILVACFKGCKSAGRARRSVETRLRDGGNDVIDTVVARVDAKRRASVYDPRRVRAGVLTATVTWGLFGLATGGGISGLVANAILGAVLGGLFAYRSEHVVTDHSLKRVGARLPADSSALLIFVNTAEPPEAVRSAAGSTATVCSAAAIRDDLTTDVANAPSVVPGTSASDEAGTRMVLVRYPDPAAAQQVAEGLSALGQRADEFQIELISSADPDGRIHVTDPAHGSRTMARGNIASWGGFGLLLGALGGIVGGGGIFGLVENAVLTGLFWAVFGALAGALYGVWAGRAVSGRELRSIRGLVTPGTSTLFAWAEGPIDGTTSDTLATPGSQQLVLHFTPTTGGTTIATSS